MHTTELVHVTRQGPVRTLTLDSPHNRNALSSQLLNELADGLREAMGDATVRLVVLTATGSVFCSGADLSEPTATVTTRLPEVLLSIRGARVPVVARVNGHARAGGLGLITAADMAVALAGSTFAFSEVRVGVAPAIILVPALAVTERRFLARAALTGETFDATQAARAGILNDVVTESSQLDEWVEGVATSVLRAAPGAVGATKALLAELPEMPWSHALLAAQARSAELFAQSEAIEGMEAFLQKRKPSWDVAP